MAAFRELSILILLVGLQLLPSPSNAQANNSASCLEGDIRLRDGVSASSGRVEICYNNAWGTVCDDVWSASDADVACRQLGFIGSRRVLTGASVVDGSGQIVLDDLRCRGNESRLVDCPHNGLGNHNCIHSEDAGVSCFEACEGSIRLVGGSSEYEGFIDICANNTLGGVCDRSWTVADASVVCRQLGHSTLGAVPRRNTSFPNYRSATVFRAVLGDAICNGNETRLVDCQHPDFGSQSCSSFDRVGVSCQPLGTEAMCRDGDVRLVGLGSTTRGRLQFCYGSVWGAVCRTNFDQNAATVVCKELGVASAGIAHGSYGSLESVYGVLLLDRVGCTGGESRLAECSANPIGDIGGRYGYECSTEAGVQCFPGFLLVQTLSGGESFAILFCCLLFVGSIIVLVLGLAYYKQRQYKKLVRTHSSSDGSSDIHPPTTNETAQGVEQVGVATPDEPTPINQDPTHSASEPPPPAYCETSDLEQ